MKKLITTVLLICILAASAVSCTKTEADTPGVYDLSAEAGIETATGDDLNVETVKDIINKAVEIYEKNEAVKLDSERTVYSDETIYRRDVSHIDLEFAKTCTKDNYSEPFEFYRDYLYDIRSIAIELLMDYFPEENTVVADIPPHINSLPPTHTFYIQKSDNPEREIKVVAWNDDIYYHEGEEKPVRLFPLPEQNEIEQQFWRINNHEEEIPLY